MGSPFSPPLQPLATTHPLCVTVFCCSGHFQRMAQLTLGGLQGLASLTEHHPAVAAPALCSSSCLNDTSAWMDHVFFIQLVDVWVGSTFGAVMNNNSAINSWTSRRRTAWYRVRRRRQRPPGTEPGWEEGCHVHALPGASRLCLDSTQVWSLFCRHCVTEGPCLCWSLRRRPPAHQETWWPCWACTVPVSGRHPAGGLGWALVLPEGCMLRSLPQLTTDQSPRMDRVRTCHGDRRPDPLLDLLVAAVSVQAITPTTSPPSAWTTS